LLRYLPTLKADSELTSMTSKLSGTKAGQAAKHMLGPIAVLAVVTLFGAYRIADPFDGDQALFLQYARTLARGGILYVDVWDNKQPGIYWFYLVGGTLFGFTEPGVHLFELLYQLLFCAVLMATLRGWLRKPWLTVLAPITCVGVYYANTGLWHLTQIEFLVAFPLFLTLWLAAAPWPSIRQRRHALFCAGVCAGVVVSYKLALAPIVAAGWLMSLWTSNVSLSANSFVRERLIPAGLGLLLILGSLALWFALHDALSILAWTSFVYPLRASKEIPHQAWSTLASSIRWYVVISAPWLVVAGAAGVRWRGRREEWLTMQLLAWLASGFAVILLQKFSWWAYHFTLLIVPVGLLATRGADGLIARVPFRAQRAITVALASALFISPAVVVIWRLSRADFRQVLILASVRDPRQLLDYQRRFSPDYDQIWRNTRFLLGRDALPGPIYVFGNPLYFQFAGRDQAIATHGWAWEFLLQSQWSELPTQLSRAVPSYIFVSPYYDQLLRTRSARTLAWIRSKYAILFSDSAGTWYILHRPRTPK
jgi:hypothetical protein